MRIHTPRETLQEKLYFLFIFSHSQETLIVVVSLLDGMIEMVQVNLLVIG